MSQASPKVSRSVNGHPHGRVPRAVREEQLLEVAEQVFGTQGYQGTSIEDIARTAGVTRPVVYDHFGSKEGIYLACVRRARAELERLINEAAGGKDDAGEALWGGINAYFEFVERHGRAWDVLFGQGSAVAGPAAEEVTRQRFATVQGIAELLTPFVAAPDADAEAI
jgi:AcrR family transcriptional regulator